MYNIAAFRVNLCYNMYVMIIAMSLLDKFHKLNNYFSLRYVNHVLEV